MIEPNVEIIPAPPKRNLLPFFMVVGASVILVGMSLLPAIEAQSPNQHKANVIPPEIEPVSPETPLPPPTLNTALYELLAVVNPLALIAGVVLLALLASKELIRGPVLPVEWKLQPTWTALDVLLVVLIAIAIMIPLQFFFPKETDKPITAGGWVAEIIFRVLTVAALLAVAASRHRKSGELSPRFAALGLHADRLWPSIRIGLVAFLCFHAVDFGLNWAELRVVRHFQLNMIVQDPVELMYSAKSLATLIALPCLAIVLAPVTEELFFRGFLQGVLRTTCGSNLAILAAALFFASAHMNIFFFVRLFALGLTLGYLYDRTQSLAAPITTHFCQNAYTLCAIVAVKLAQH